VKEGKDVARQRVEELMQLDEVGALDVPMSLFGLAVQDYCIGRHCLLSQRAVHLAWLVA
jgi:hypothetical protein